MFDYKRVQLEDGSKTTVAFVQDGMKVLDEPATRRSGVPIPPEPAPSPQQKAADTRAANKTSANKAAKKTASSDGAPTTTDDTTPGDADTSKEDSQ